MSVVAAAVAVVTAVTACYAPLRNGSKLFLSKKHTKKKTKCGGRRIERREKIKKENGGAKDIDRERERRGKMKNMLLIC